MASDSFKVKNSVNIASGGSPSAEGDITVNSNKLGFHNGTTSSPVVTEAHTATLTNKTFDADGTGNSITNIENADIKAAAAIDATKIADGSISNTEFQYLNGVSSAIQTQIDAKAPSASPTLSNPTMTGAIDGSASTNVDLGTSNSATTIDIGSGSGSNTINIGGANSTVNFTGTVNNQAVTNLNVTDKLITINDGGGAASGGASGIEVEENAAITGYVKTSSDRNSWQFLAPNTAGVATLSPGSGSTAVVLDTATQTLTNKTLTAPSITTPSTDVVTLDGQASAPSNPSAGNYKVYVDDTTQKLSLLDSNGTVTTVGSGSGTGINYITKPDAETNATTGWATYADAAGTSPVDGTGGSPVIEWSASNSSPLRGTYSFLLIKDGVDRQGQGVGYAFTIDSADKGKVLQGSFDYNILSGTYTDDDVSIWIYDVTNSTLIQPAPYKLKNHTLAAEKFAFEFQTSSSSTSYRFIIHYASATTNSFTLKFDNFSVGPQAKLYGSPITDWVSYTPTFTGFGTPTSISMFSRRVGDSLEVLGYFTTGTNTATTAKMSLGYGGISGNVTADSVKIGASGTMVGKMSQNAAGLNNTVLAVPSDTTVRFGLSSSNPYSAANGNSFSSTTATTVFFKVPILGWSSSVVMSSDADTRVVDFLVKRSGNQTIGPNNSRIKIQLNSITKDSHGAFDASTNYRYTIATPGDYRFDALAMLDSANVLNNRYWLQLGINGTTFHQLDLDFPAAGAYVGMSGAIIIPNLVAGDYVELYLFGAGNNSVSTLTVLTDSYLSASKLSGPAQIAASEKIRARYTDTAGQSLPSGAYTILNMQTKTYDTHSSVTIGASWKFTAQRAGYAKVSANILLVATAGWAAGEQVQLLIYKNGSLYSLLQSQMSQAAHSSSFALWGSDEVSMVAGDYIDVRAYQDNGASITLNTTAGVNYIAISMD